ncbi:MAG: histidine phosphatase family protein [Parvibaculum sp.]
MRTDWYWIRQGCIAQDPGRYTGRLDLPTLPPGAVAARRLSSRLPNGAVWLTSPAQRARASVRALSESANAISVEGLADQDLGSWAGRRRAEVHKSNPQIDWDNPSTILPEDGEGFGDVVARVAETVQRLTLHYPDRPMIAVSHAAVIRAALILALDLPEENGHLLEIAPFSLTHLSWEGPDDMRADTQEREGVWRVHHVNLTVG